MKLKEKIYLFGLNFFSIVFLFVIYLFYFPSNNLIKSLYFSNDDPNQEIIVEFLKNSEKIQITADRENFFVKKGTKTYIILKNTTITCDLYKALSKGANQSVIAYSLYGKNHRYFRLVETILKQAKQFYRNYTIRIYHDSSLNSNLIKKFEFFYENVDFCNVEYLPLNSSLMNREKFVNLSFIPPQSWRLFALGDGLINIALWRDMDSLFSQRELDSVNEWLLSDKFGHIMRDHPHHGAMILAGMWGLKLNKNRFLANQFFTKLQDKTMAPNFLKEGVARRSLDQKFLAVHVYEYIRNISVIHDSYLCEIYKDSTPFPSRRKGKCFVSSSDCNPGFRFPPCPLKRIIKIGIYVKAFLEN